MVRNIRTAKALPRIASYSTWRHLPKWLPVVLHATYGWGRQTLYEAKPLYTCRRAMEGGEGNKLAINMPVARSWWRCTTASGGFMTTTWWTRFELSFVGKQNVLRSCVCVCFPIFVFYLFGSLIIVRAHTTWRHHLLISFNPLVYHSPSSYQCFCWGHLEWFT